MSSQEPRTKNNEHRQQELTIYRPNMRHELGFFATWKVMAQNVWISRELIWQLFKRDFFAQYKKSFLGMAWIFLMPVVGIVSWVFLNKAGVLSPGNMSVPYPVYILVGTTMWGLFIGLFNAASMTLESGKDLIMQVSYPHEALLFQQAAKQLANFSIGFVLNLIVLLSFRVIPHWTTILLPLAALPLFLFASAFGLIIAMVRVVAMDIGKMTEMGLGLLMFITPVVYTMDKIENPMIQTLVKWNPLTYLVCSLRDLILFGRLYNTTGYFICAGISLLLFMISWRLFYVSEGKIVERMV
jgi:lipopolysaccharide transport system permease protein